MTCPALRLDGSAGLADALQALDCRTGEATASAFARLFGSNGVLLPALTILLTIYVAIFAIGLLTGRARIGMSSLTPRMLTLGLVLTFATSWAAYSQVVWTLVTGAPDQIASVIVGTHGSATQAFAQSLDRVFNAIADAADAASHAPPPPPTATGITPSVPVAGPGFFTPTNMLWMSGLMLLLGTVGVLVTAKIALAALLALGPVFIVLALFRGTRGLFEGWLKAVILFALVPLFAVLIGGGTLAAIMPVIRAAVMDTGETATKAVTALFLAACVYCALMAMVIKTASTIVAGWRLPGGGDPAAAHASGSAPAPLSPVPATAIGAPSAAAVAAGDRVRSMVAGMPMIANDVASSPAGSAGDRARRVTLVAPPVALLPNATATGAARRDGVGSRFRARPHTLSRDSLS